MQESQPKLDPLLLRAVTRGRLRFTPRVALAICSHDMGPGRVEVCATNGWGSPFLHGLWTPPRDVTPEQCRAFCEAYIMRRARMESELAALETGPFPALAVGDEFIIGDEILWVSARTKAGKLTIEPIATRWYDQTEVYTLLAECSVYDKSITVGKLITEGDTKIAANGWETLYSRAFVERLVREPKTEKSTLKS